MRKRQRPIGICKTYLPLGEGAAAAADEGWYAEKSKKGQRKGGFFPFILAFNIMLPGSAPLRPCGASFPKGELRFLQIHIYTHSLLAHHTLERHEVFL